MEQIINTENPKYELDLTWADLIRFMEKEGAETWLMTKILNHDRAQKDKL